MTVTFCDSHQLLGLSVDDWSKIATIAGVLLAALTYFITARTQRAQQRSSNVENLVSISQQIASLIQTVEGFGPPLVVDGAIRTSPVGLASQLSAIQNLLLICRTDPTFAVAVLGGFEALDHVQGQDTYRAELDAAKAELHTLLRHARLRPTFFRTAGR